MDFVISGYAHSGKTTVANALCDKLVQSGANKENIRFLKFAAPIYQAMNVICDKKNRLFMQEFADLTKKYFNKTIFLDIFRREFESIKSKNPKSIVICDDCRYIAEINLCKTLGFRSIYTNCSQSIREKRANRLGIVFNNNHNSEQELDSICKISDYIIATNKSIESIVRQIFYIVNNI